MACIYSINDDINNSIKWINYVLNLSPDLAGRIDKDTDLNNVRNSKSYQELIKQYIKSDE